MNALGEHLIIRKPEKENEKGGIIMPDTYDEDYAYGKVKSIGPLAEPLLGGKIEEGDLVLFDPHGARMLELGATSKKGGELVAAHASMIFCKVHPDQLESRKLPLPK